MRRIRLCHPVYLLPAIIVILLIVMITLVGCAGNTDSVPMPTAGNANPDKHYSPEGVLRSNQIAIPFPYGDNFKNGQELWYLDTDSSGHMIVKVTWRGLEVASFPVNDFGTNPSTGKIVLDSKHYSAVSVHLNYSSMPNSGWVVLQEN